MSSLSCDATFTTAFQVCHLSAMIETGVLMLTELNDLLITEFEVETVTQAPS